MAVTVTNNIKMYTGHTVSEWRNISSFAVIKSDGSVVTWGDPTSGGDSSAVALQLDGTIKATQIFAAFSAYAVIRNDGSVVTWGDTSYGGDSTAVAAQLNGTKPVTQIFSTGLAFAALRSDGSVVTWGDLTSGGDSSSVSVKLNGSIPVTQISSTEYAFAALRADGSVITWGDINAGADSSSVSGLLNGAIPVTQISSNGSAFAALRSNGSVVTWGDVASGGDSSSVSVKLNGSVPVTQVISSTGAFAALRADGSVVTWGDTTVGGNSNTVANQLNGVIKTTQIYSDGSAFAALRADGSVVTWGDSSAGGSSNAVAANLNGQNPVIQIFQTNRAFAALRADGSVVTWGDSSAGGDSSSVASQINGSNKVIQIYSNDNAFAALRADGSVITWGDSNYGGNSSSVASKINGSVKVSQIFANTLAFAALRSDGSIITWGDSYSGGNSNSLASKLTSGVVSSANIYTNDIFQPDKVIFGTAGNDILTSGAGNDTINGLAGADTMTGGIGNDTYYVDNPGDKVIELPNEGIDTINSSTDYTLPANVENLNLLGSAIIANGNSSDNIINGNAQNNTINAGPGNDFINGGAGADTMSGGLGNDTYVIDNIDDQVMENANSGNDTIQSSISYTLPDNVENLTLTGSANLTATGNNLNNILTDNMGQSILSGGLGDDTYVVNNVKTQILEAVNAGNDTVQSSINYILGNNLENLTLTGINNIYGVGNNFNNVIIGNSFNNYINGGLGADTMNGGLGDDTYAVDNIKDVIIEAVNAGIDTVQSSISYTLGTHLENLSLVGTADTNATGNDYNNTLVGNSGNNVLDGVSGADFMSGGFGNDTYVVENTGDVVLESTNAGTDTVLSSISYVLTSNVENLTLTGTADNTATGNNLNNLLQGNSGNNLLNGGLDADTLSGGAGNDTYIVDNIGDSVIESANAGNDIVLASVSYVMTDNVENLTLTGTGNLNGTGNSLNNTIIGTDGNNLIDGGAGADTMTGGLDNDTYVVDNSGDVINESANAGIDTVQSSINYTLGLTLENLTLTGSANLTGTGNNYNNVIVSNLGVDILTGGIGDDTYVINNSADQIVESANAGNDSVQSTVNYTLSNNLENLTLIGNTDINAVGNGLNNNLQGNTGNNLLDGGLDADTMAGGIGNDTYVVDNIGDGVIESANAGIDTVQSSINYTIGSNLENLTLTGSADLTGTGNSVANIVTGNSGNNLLDGGLGADTMAGGLGNDTYMVDNVNDVISESVNAGIDSVISSVSYTLSDNVENLTLTGSLNLNGTGNALNNTLLGNSGNNVLTGGAGNDTITGGNGADTLVGGLGADTINLAETVASTDIVRIATGDSQVTGYDVVTSFQTGLSASSSVGVDKLDLPTTIIASNISSVDGLDAGTIKSHSIANGIISFSTANTFSSAATINSGNLSDVLNYVQSNLTKFGTTVAFNTTTDAYVFQDGGVNTNDTLVELVGTHLNSIDTKGLGVGDLWIA